MPSLHGLLWTRWSCKKGQDPLFAPQRDECQGHSSFLGWVAKTSVSLECVQGHERILGLSQQCWGQGVGQTVLFAGACFPLKTYFRWCLEWVSALISMLAVWGTDLKAQMHLKLLG